MKASSIKASCITKLYVHWNTVLKKKKRIRKSTCDQCWCIYYPNIKTVFVELQSNRANHRQVLPEGIVCATSRYYLYFKKKKKNQSVHPCINSTQLQSVVHQFQVTLKSFAKSLSCCWGFIFIRCYSEHFAVTMTDSVFSWLYIF